jgi:methionine transaminase
MNSKLPHIGNSIFTIMSQLAIEHKAINLSQGFPGFDCDPALSQLVNKYMKEGRNQYAPMSGMPALREALAVKTEKNYGVAYDAEKEITITSGATEALFAAITATVQKGDEVILMEPAYDSYGPTVELNGGVPVYVSLRLPEFSVDWELVRAAITSKTRLIVVNTPHNPGGYVWTKEDLNTLAEIIADREIYVVSDEVYEHIVFDGRQHLSLCTHPVLKEKTFVCGSFGKTFHITGWKIGYCLAPEKLSAELRKIHQFLTFSVSSPMQLAIAEYLREPKHYRGLPEFYRQKRDLFCEGLKNTPFKFIPAQGSFFQLVEFGHLTEESDYDLAVRLTTEVGVASIPVSPFYHDRKDPRLLRFCFAKDDAELEKALEKLSKGW